MTTVIHSVSKRCPSCQSALDATLCVCGTCGFSFASGTALPKWVKVTPIKIPVTAQLHYLIDSTGSTRVRRERVKGFVQRTNSVVGTKAAKLIASVYASGDLDYGQQTVALAQTVSADQAEAAIEPLDYSGGGDLAETHLDSLQTVLGWIPPAGIAERHSVIAFFTDESKPLRSGASAHQLGQEFRLRQVYPVLVCQPCPLLQEFVDASGGMLFQIAREPSESEANQVAALVGGSIVTTLSAARQKTISTVIS